MNGIFNEDTQGKGIKIVGTHKGKGLRFWGHTKEYFPILFSFVCPHQTHPSTYMSLTDWLKGLLVYIYFF